jgi:hypothetical protein
MKRLLARQSSIPGFLALGFIVLVVVSIVGLATLRATFGRMQQFRAKAKAGQPLVWAIEKFREETGDYPVSLTNLAPLYLATVPELPNPSNNQFSGWNYEVVTNAGKITFRLSYYMGRGGVEYVPPHWIGNNEGSKKVVLSNE